MTRLFPYRVRLLLALTLMLPLCVVGCDDSGSGPGSEGASRSAAPSGGAGSVAIDERQAQRELDELQTRFQNVLEQRGELGAVREDARRYVEKYPRVAAGRVLLGQIELTRGQFKAAAEQFDRALEIDPRQAEVRASAGTVAMQMDDLEAAERHYAQAVGLDSDNPSYRVMLGTVYMQQAHYDRAELALLEALRLDSTYHRAHAVLSDVYARQNRLAMALDQCDRAIVLADAEPRWRTVYIRRKAQLQLRANRPDEALRTLGELPPRVQVELEVARQKAECWQMLGEPGRAADYFEQMVSLDPTHADAMAEAVRWMLRADRRDAARRMLDRLRQTDPRHEAIDDLRRQLEAAAPAPD